MNRAIVCALAALLILSPRLPAVAAEPSRSGSDKIQISAGDWPWWRGPHGNGVSASEGKPPLNWSTSQNVRWQVPVPGRGHGSPTVVGDQVFLATAEQQPPQQSVMCWDRKTGRQLWRTVVHRAGLTSKGNEKSSLASSTVACDGQRVFVNFLNGGAVYTTALNLQGKLLWQTKITDYVIHQGYGSSPRPYGPLVLVSADNRGGGAIAGLDRVSGEVIWRVARPQKPNYASPIVLQAAGRTQLLLTGCNLVTGLEPLSGQKLWEIEGSTTECVTSAVTDGKLVFTSGGYPKNHMSAVRADGSGEIVWENKVRVYVPSMLVHQGYLYSVVDAGIAMCWDCGTGKQVWKGRLGGTFSASPVLAGNLIYVTNESGESFIFKATPDAFSLVARNQLGNEVFATPAICGNRIFMRVAMLDGDQRQEFLYCLGDS